MKFFVRNHGLFAKVLNHGGFVWVTNKLAATRFNREEARSVVRRAVVFGFGGAAVQPIG